MPYQTEDGLKSAIVILLESNQEIGMKCDLACYPTHDGFFFVDYILCPETVTLLNLTEKERKMLTDEEELSEMFDKAEDAADFYLRLSNGKLSICSDPYHGNGHNGHSKKRTYKEKALAYDKDKYF